MLRTWERMLESRNAGLKLATALAVFCVATTLLLSLRALNSASSLQTRIDRDYALTAAQQRVLTGFARQDTARVEQTLDALLAQADYGFRYLAVRDLDGSVLAARGRYEALNRSSALTPALRRWLRATLYTVFGEAGLLTLREGDRTVGSLEYAIGSTSARLVRDEAVDRLRTTGWIAGTLALLFGGATLLMLRAALTTATLPATRQAGAGGPPSPSPAMPRGAGEDPLPLALDALKVAVLDIDAELRVRLINDTAASLSG